VEGEVDYKVAGGESDRLDNDQVVLGSNVEDTIKRERVQGQGSTEATMTKMNEAAFQRMRRDLDEALLLPQRAAAVLGRRSADLFTGLAELLDCVLPAARTAEARLARALHIDESVLRSLRSGRMDPYALPNVEALVRLGQLMSLSLATCVMLLDRDHEALGGSLDVATARGNRVRDQGRATFRAVWERMNRDDPSAYASLAKNGSAGEPPVRP
jgi:hypothetical protein